MRTWAKLPTRLIPARVTVLALTLVIFGNSGMQANCLVIDYWPNQLDF